jgi:hypothetical protein
VQQDPNDVLFLSLADFLPTDWDKSQIFLDKED